MLFLNIIREIKKSPGRYLAILAIVALGTGFYCGLKASTDAMVSTCDNYLRDANFYDFWLRSGHGIDQDSADKIKSNKSVRESEFAYSFDLIFDAPGKNSTVLHSMSIPKKINKPLIKRGRLPKNDDECLLDEAYPNAKSLLGKTITVSDGNELATLQVLKSKQFRVVGLCNSPLYLSSERGSTPLGNGTVSGFIYLKKSVFLSPVYTDAYLTCGSYEKIYSDSYKNKIEKYKSKFDGLADHILDRESNAGYVSFENDTSIIASISTIFPAFFFAIAALVCMTSMTRMIDEHRMQLGVYKALGYSSLSILSIYLFYSATATVIGTITGYFGGITITPQAIWRGYKTIYFFADKLEFTADKALGVFALIVALMSTCFATIATCLKETGEYPALLIRPRAPKSGKKILLERCSLLWDKLPFIYKISLRNVFRYKGRLLMTLIGISGCTALLVAGFGLRSSMSNITNLQYENIEHFDYSVVFSSPLASHAEKSFVNFAKKKGSAEKIKFCSQQTMNYGGKTKENKSVGSLKLVTTSKEKFRDFIDLRNGKRKVDFPGDGKIVLCKKYAKIYKLSKGDKIRLVDEKLNSYEFELSDVFDNYIYNYAYISPETYRSVFGKDTKLNIALVKTNLKGANRDSNISMSAAKLRNYDNVISVSAKDDFRQRIDKMLQSLAAIIVLIVISAGTLAFVVLYNITNINITERKREIATVKVLGFYPRETSAYVSRENLLLTLMSTLIGLPLGKLLLKLIISQIKVDLVYFPVIVSQFDYLYSFMLTMAFAVIVVMLMHIKIHRINMSDSLKSIE